MEPVLSKILKSDALGVKTAYRFSKFLKRASKELQDLEEARQKLVIKYGATDADGSVQVVEAMMPSFMKDYEEVLKEETEISFQPVPVSSIDGVGLTPGDLILLENLIWDDEVPEMVEPAVE